jgi:hypothetical protein
MYIHTYVNTYTHTHNTCMYIYIHIYIAIPSSLCARGRDAGSSSKELKRAGSSVSEDAGAAPPGALSEKFHARTGDRNSKKKKK